MRVDGPSTWRQRTSARVAVLSVAEGALRDEYAGSIRPFYDSRYENLVLSGTALRAPQLEPLAFFFVSGVHGKGFPWADGELFSDVLLVIGSPRSGYRRYCITDRVLPGLELDVTSGTCSYRGPIFDLCGGCAASFANLTGDASGLSRLYAEVDLQFETRSGHAVPFPFPRTNPLLRRIRSGLSGWLSHAMPGTSLPGIHVTPCTATVTSGSIRIRPGEHATGSDEWVIEPASTFGECERGAFRHLKWPTLAYRYYCTVNTSRRVASVRIVASAMPGQRGRGSVIDRLVSRLGSVTYVVSEEGVNIESESPAQSRRDGYTMERQQPVLEVSHGQFPTAVLLRRVVETVGDAGVCLLAFEEDMLPRGMDSSGGQAPSGNGRRPQSESRQ
jgi:hypothetical protein